MVWSTYSPSLKSVEITSMEQWALEAPLLIPFNTEGSEYLTYADYDSDSSDGE